MPKETNLKVEGTVSVGSPEDYRRVALNLEYERRQEYLLLSQDTYNEPGS
jgi:hypothetical protein